ncbi:iron-siderophore ABC transporter substrate-binding protein [Cellulomonas hominis]|uniref:iron-siderophore ABC transporter substrate-binding protein n=1 Tax=Cellulomonas hominis TaxID=156981 RepID=UPI001B989ACC|nr:iron-siderophore ABC transporter substrate-binding protein [Cellulomonas hominis]VTR75320.1 putative siderophore-binding lipoprotein YfiY [Cellulomonas hominis]
MHRTSARSLRRRPALAVTLVVGALALTACGGSDDPASGDASTTASGDFEPVTIESALGEAVIEEQPERVVTLGQGSAETAIALGVVPVGIEEYPWGSDETGYLPWIHDAVEDLGAELPVQFTGGEEIDVDTILELEPDVILAPWSGITQEQFDLLSDIAPTVAYPDLPWSTDWDQQIETVATALGHADEAQGLIDGIEQEWADAAAEHPEYADLTFSFIYTTGPGTLGVFLPDEQRVAMVRGLGLQVDPVVETFEETEGTDSAVIGLENADQLKDSDLVFTFYSSPESKEEVVAQPLYQSIPAIARDSVVAPSDQPFVTGSSIITPLTVPWAIDEYTALIDEAVAKLG